MRVAGATVAGVLVYVGLLWLLTGSATPGVNESSVVWALLVVAFVVGLAATWST